MAASVLGSAVLRDAALKLAGSMNALTLQFIALDWGFREVIKNQAGNASLAEQAAVLFGDLKRQYRGALYAPRDGVLNLADDQTMVKQDANGQWQYVHASANNVGAVQLTAVARLDLSTGTIDYATGNTMATSTVQEASFGVGAYLDHYDFNASNWVGNRIVHQNQGPEVDLTAALAGSLTRQFDVSQITTVVLPIAPTAKYRFTGLAAYTAWQGPDDGAYGVDVVHQDLESQSIFFDAWNTFSGQEITKLDVDYQASTIDIVLSDRYMMLATPTIPEAWQGKLTYRITGEGCGYQRLALSDGARYDIRGPAMPGEVWMLTGSDADAPQLSQSGTGNLAFEIGGASVCFEAADDADNSLPSVYYSALSTPQGAAPIEHLYKLQPSGVQALELPLHSATATYGPLLVVGEINGCVLLMDNLNHVLYEASWDGRVRTSIDDVTQAVITDGDTVILTMRGGTVWEQHLASADDKTDHFIEVGLKGLPADTGPRRRSLDAGPNGVVQGVVRGAVSDDGAEIPQPISMLDGKPMTVEYEIAPIVMFGQDGQAGYYDSVNQVIIDLGGTGRDYLPLGAAGGRQYYYSAEQHTLVGLAANLPIKSYAHLRQAHIQDGLLTVQMDNGCTFVLAALTANSPLQFHLISVDVDLAAQAASLLATAPATRAAAAQWAQTLLTQSGFKDPSGAAIGAGSLINGMLSLTGSWSGAGDATYDAATQTYQDNYLYGRTADGHMALMGVRNTSNRSAAQAKLSLSAYLKNILQEFTVSGNDGTATALYAPVLTLMQTANASGRLVKGWYDTAADVAVIPDLAAAPAGLCYAGYDGLSGRALLFDSAGATLYVLDAASGQALQTLQTPFDIATASLDGNFVYLQTSDGVLYAGMLGAGGTLAGQWQWVGVTDGWTRQFGDLSQSANLQKLEAGLKELQAQRPLDVDAAAQIRAPQAGTPWVYSSQAQRLIGVDPAALPGDAELLGMQADYVDGQTKAVWFSRARSTLYTAARDGKADPLCAATASLPAFKAASILGTTLSVTVDFTMSVMSPAQAISLDAVPCLEGVDTLIIDGVNAQAGLNRLIVAPLLLDYYSALMVNQPVTVILEASAAQIEVRRDNTDLILSRSLDGHEILLHNAVTADGQAASLGWKVRLSGDNTTWSIADLLSRTATLDAPGAITLLSPSAVDADGRRITAAATPQIEVALNGAAAHPAQIGDVVQIHDASGTLVGLAVVTAADLSRNSVRLTLGDTLSSGLQRLTAVLYDPDHRTTSAVGPALTFDVDTRGPSIAVTIDSNGSALADDGSFMASGAAGSVVRGTLSAPLAKGDALAVSVDGGVTWQRSSAAGSPVKVSGTNWTFADPGTHRANWRIDARVVDAAGNAGLLASQAVTLSAASAIRPLAARAILTQIGHTIAAADSTWGCDFLAAAGLAAPVLSGTLSRALRSGETVRVSLDDGRTWAQATVKGTAWSYTATRTYATTLTVLTQVTSTDARVADTPDPYLVKIDPRRPTARATIGSMSHLSGLNDWTTADGSAGNLVQGTLTQALDAAGQNNVLQVSFDGGHTWNSSDRADSGIVVDGLNWQAVDQGTHGTDWTIQTRIVSHAGLDGAVVAQTVKLRAGDLAGAVVPTIGWLSTDTNPDDTTFTTWNYAPNAVVGGTLNGHLQDDQILQISFDGGRTWSGSDQPDSGVSVDGLRWRAVNPNNPIQDQLIRDWTIQARVLASGVPGKTVSKQVNYLNAIPSATPTITALTLPPDAGRQAKLTVTVAHPAAKYTVQLSGDGGVTWVNASPVAGSTTQWQGAVAFDPAADRQRFMTRVVDAAGNYRAAITDVAHLAILSDLRTAGTVRFTQALDSQRFAASITPSAAVLQGSRTAQAQTVKPVLSTNASLNAQSDRSDRVWLYGVYNGTTTDVVRLELTLQADPRQVGYQVSAWTKYGNWLGSLANEAVGDDTWSALPYAPRAQSLGLGLAALDLRAVAQDQSTVTASGLIVATQGQVMPLALGEAGAPLALNAVTPSAATLQGRFAPLSTRINPVLSRHSALTGANKKTWLYGVRQTDAHGATTTSVVSLTLTPGKLGNEALDYQVTAWTKAGDQLGSLATQAVNVAGGWRQTVYANTPLDNGIGLADVGFTATGQTEICIEGVRVLGAMAQHLTVNPNGQIGLNLRPGDGANRVEEQARSNQDYVDFGTDIRHDQLWFSRQGDDLDVRVIGTADRITFDDWFDGSGDEIRKFYAADGGLLAGQVGRLVQAMAALTPPPMGQTVLSENDQKALAPVFASTWEVRT